MHKFKKMVLEKQQAHDRRKNIFLYFATFIVQITSFTCGLAFSWSSPIAPKLETIGQNPLGIPLSANEISWLASLLSLGSAVGPFAGGYLADKIGRKRTFIACIIPTIASFIILAFAQTLFLYYLCRFLMGCCVGIFLTVVPMYIGEVAEVHNRGTLGCITGVSICSGILFGFSVGPYISIMWFNLFCVIPPALFLVVFPLMIPETPYYLLMIGKHDEAQKSLKKYRCSYTENEFLTITATVKESLTNDGGILDILKTKYLLKGLCLTMGLMLTQQITGIGVVIYYLQSIFEKADTQIPTEICAIIIGIIQIIATSISSAKVDKLGRRPLLLLSTTATSITLIILSIYFYLLTIIDMSKVNWLPIITLIIYIFSFNIGIGPLPMVILSELFPPHVKSAASALTMSWAFIFSFGITKIFPLLTSWIGIWFGFLFFAGCNIVGVLFIWVFVCETKGKTLAEILDSLK